MNGFHCKKCKSRFSRARALIVACVFTALASPGCAAQAPTEEVARIVELLHLAPGMRVADVGAGDGEWTEALARAVGETGHVYATEIEQDLVDEVRERAAAAGLDNVTAVLGDDRRTGLEEDCCDAILLRLVYHHFTDPAAMRRSLLAALRPGGRLAVIDLAPQKDWRHLEGVPDRGGHGIPVEDLIAEMTAAGFAVEAVHPDWRSDDEDRYCVVFAAPQTR
jgi:protein-L-isoaspartate O-methyltransferase